MNWNMILGFILDAATPVVAIILQVLFAVLIVIITKLGNKLLVKMGVNLKDSELKEIEEIVKKTVKTINQTFVDDLKNIADNHKLTDDQKEEAYNMAYETILTLLSNDQLDALYNKYGDIAAPIKVMIESTIADFKNESDKDSEVFTSE